MVAMAHVWKSEDSLQESVFCHDVEETGSNSSPQAGQQTPLPTEPFTWPSFLLNRQRQFIPSLLVSA